MGQAFTPGLAVKKVAEVSRVRELPVPGEVLVKVGDRVTSGQTVARAFLPGDLHILRIAEKLAIEPFEVAKGLRVRQGDTVREGDLLCEHAGLFGLFKSRYNSPVDGIVELVTEGTGHVAVRSAAKPIQIDAYISGVVTAVDPGKSATITARGAFVQGIFGVGGERRGTILIVNSKSPKLEPTDMPGDVSGAVLVCKARPTLGAIHAASNGGAAALVSGSIDDAVLAGYLGYDLGIALTGDEDIPMSVIITEGFGDLPMSDRTFELLKSLQGKEASINGATQVRAGALRPEIIVAGDSAESGAETAALNSALQIGTKVRIIRVPYFGQSASVVELPHEMKKIPTGAFARVLVAKLPNGELVTVPRANVELI